MRVGIILAVLFFANLGIAQTQVTLSVEGEATEFPQFNMAYVEDARIFFNPVLPGTENGLVPAILAPKGYTANWICDQLGYGEAFGFGNQEQFMALDMITIHGSSNTGPTSFTLRSYEEPTEVYTRISCRITKVTDRHRTRRN